MGHSTTLSWATKTHVEKPNGNLYSLEREKKKHHVRWGCTKKKKRKFLFVRNPTRDKVKWGRKQGKNDLTWTVILPPPAAAAPRPGMYLFIPLLSALHVFRPEWREAGRGGAGRGGAGWKGEQGWLVGSSWVGSFFSFFFFSSHSAAQVSQILVTWV